MLRPSVADRLQPDDRLARERLFRLHVGGREDRLRAGKAN